MAAEQDVPHPGTGRRAGECPRSRRHSAVGRQIDPQSVRGNQGDQAVRTTGHDTLRHTHRLTAPTRQRASKRRPLGRGAVSADEAVLKDYFAQAFAERRNIYKEMFARLDGALYEGNGEELLERLTVRIRE
jgi:hypothetical protein